jgi:hypothetical protein
MKYIKSPTPQGGKKAVLKMQKAFLSNKILKG